MRPRALIGVALLAAVGAGCRRPLPAEGLPDSFAAVLALPDGDLLSVLVELPRPGVDPIVRLAEGAVAVDEGWGRAWIAERTAAGTSTLLDLAGDGEWGAPLDPVGAPPVELWSMDRDGAVLRSGGRYWRQLARPGAALEPLSGDPPPPGGQLTHPGPAGGFALRLEDGRLDVLLPRGGSPGWTPIVHGVDHLVGCWWLVSTALPPWQRRVVDDRFKQVGVLDAEQGEAVVDGDLSEWRGQDALPVTTPSQILQGQPSWGGERDGGFGVAVRRAGARAVVAVRVRDDVVDAPHDQLVLRSGAQELWVPLDGHRGETDAHGWRAVRAQRRGWDQAVEVELPAEAVDTLVVQLIDSDPEQAPTLLATVSYPVLLERGRLVLDPAGPLRPAPQ